MKPPGPSLSRRHLFFRIAALCAGALGIAYFAVLTARERAQEPKVTEVVVRPVRHAWSLNTGEGAIRGESDALDLPEGTPGSTDIIRDPASGRFLAVDRAGGLRAAAAGGLGRAAAGTSDLVTGVAPLDHGRVAFCLGRSGFGPDYFLLVLDPGRPSAREARIPIGFCTTLVAAAGRDVCYATRQSRLAVVTAEGAERWKIVLDQVPTALAVSPEGRVAVGDERGGLTLCSAGGRVAWTIAVGDFPITATGFVGSDILVEVDSRGSVGVFNRQGRLFRRFDLGPGAAPFRAIVAGSGAVDFISEGGRIFRTSGIAPLPAGDLRARTVFRALGTALLARASLLLGVAGSSAAASWLARLCSRAIAGRHGYLLTLPTFALLAVFCYYPMATALGYSFGKFSLIAPWEFAGLGNFREMASDPYLLRSIVNMLVLLCTGLVKMIALPLLAAELVFWLPSERWQQFFRAALIFPAVVPGVVLALVWKMIYDPYNGLINVSLRALGWGDAAHAWLGDERFALASVVFYNFPWINLLIFLLFLGGLIQVDRSVFEAVEMDGATILQRFWSVDLPALRPQMNVAITLIFIWSVQDFASVLILTGGGPGMATYVPALQMFTQISDGHNLGYSSAIGMVLFLAVVAFTLAVRKFNREEES